MKLLKNPLVAVLLSLLIVVLSTLLSVDLKLSRKVENVANGFYEGVKVSGSVRPSIASALSDLCDAGDQLAVIADNYGLDTDSLLAGAADLRLSLNARSHDAHAIYGEYSRFNKALMVLEDALARTGLSDRHREQLEDLEETIAYGREAIANAGYNESVSAFLRRCDRFPTRQWADMFGIRYPSQFA